MHDVAAFFHYFLRFMQMGVGDALFQIISYIDGKNREFIVTYFDDKTQRKVRASSTETDPKFPLNDKL